MSRPPENTCLRDCLIRHPASEAAWQSVLDEIVARLTHCLPDGPLADMNAYVVPKPAEPNPQRPWQSLPTQFEGHVAWWVPLGDHHRFHARLVVDRQGPGLEMEVQDTTPRKEGRHIPPFWMAGHLDRACWSSLARGLRNSLIAAQAHCLEIVGTPHDASLALAQAIMSARWPGTRFASDCDADLAAAAPNNGVPETAPPHPVTPASPSP